MHRFSVLLVLAGACLASGALSGQSTEDRSIFGPVSARASENAATDPDLEALQFCGVMALGDERSFNFTDPRTRKSFWLPANGTEQGFSVESYDSTGEKVVVRRGSFTRTIPLRKTVVASSGPAAGGRVVVPVATNATPAAPRPPGSGVDEIKNPKTPEEIKQAEFEARMLVSDLMDISYRAREEQRKLREAQARGQNPAPAGSGAATGANASPPANR